MFTLYSLILINYLTVLSCTFYSSHLTNNNYPHPGADKISQLTTSSISDLFVYHLLCFIYYLSISLPMYHHGHRARHVPSYHYILSIIKSLLYLDQPFYFILVPSSSRTGSSLIFHIFIVNFFSISLNCSIHANFIHPL